MAGKVRYSIGVTPIETLGARVGDFDEDIIMSEVQDIIGCSSQDIALTQDNLALATHGFEVGVPYILTAPAVANDSSSTTQLPSVGACDLLYIENTGYQQSSSGTLQTTTANTVDYLIVQSHATGTSGIELALLKANEGVVFPLRATANANTFYIRSGNADGNAAGGNTLGAKFLALQ